MTEDEKYTEEFFKILEETKKEVKEYFKKNPMKKVKEKLTKTQKQGWIELIENNEIQCRLRKDGELDHELVVPVELLNEEQKQLVRLGQIIKYDMKKEEVKFLKETEEELIWV